MSKVVERAVEKGVPLVHHYPQIRSGTCEWCGVVDPLKPAEIQYQLCEHYKGRAIECSYCDASKDPREVTRMGIINVVDHPYNPAAMIAWCDRTECIGKHEKRFKN